MPVCGTSGLSTLVTVRFINLQHKPWRIVNLNLYHARKSSYKLYDSYFTRINGLNENSSATVEGMVGSPLLNFSYGIKQEQVANASIALGMTDNSTYSVMKYTITFIVHTFAHASFFKITSLSGSTCRANFRLLTVYS